MAAATDGSIASRARSILIFITSQPDSAIGENICKLPMLRVLRAAAPHAHIAYVHGEKNVYLKGPMAPFARGLIDEFVEGVVLHEDLFAPATLGPLQNRRFDIVIDTQGNAGPMLRLHGLTARGGAFISPFWRHTFSHPRPPYAAKTHRLAQRLLNLLGAIAPNAPRPSAQTPLPQEYAAAARAALPDGPTYVGVAPGAGNKEVGKCWPLERFVAIAQAQVVANRTPVLFIGPDEREWAETFRANAPGVIIARDLHERFGADLEALPFSTALGERLTAAVANCAGPGHLLAAGGAAMVSLFGPTKPEKFFPYCARGRWLRAGDFGEGGMAALPFDAVRDALEAEIALGRPPAGAPGI